MAQAIEITREQAIRRAVVARAKGASIRDAVEIATGKRDRRTQRAAQRGARKAAESAASATQQGSRFSFSRTLEQRLRDRLAERYVAEIVRRGGETTIETESGSIELGVTDRIGSMALLRAEGWRHYSRRFGSRPASIVYLAGLDDSGPWAVRVAGTIRSVGEALSWITPARVRDARVRGMRVLRQGDVYAVECRQDRALTDARGLPASHVWDPDTRTLHHVPEDGRQHAPLEVPFPARLIRQRVYGMGRGAGRAYGD